MPKKPENTGPLNKLLNIFRAFADGLTGSARSVAQSASTTAKSAVDQASTAAATAGSVIKENPGKTAAVAGAVIATAAAAVAGKKVYVNLEECFGLSRSTLASGHAVLATLPMEYCN